MGNKALKLEEMSYIYYSVFKYTLGNLIKKKKKKKKKFGGLQETVAELGVN